MTSSRRAPLPRAVRWLAAAYVVALGVLLLAPSSDPPTWFIERTAELAQGAGVPPRLAAAARVEVLLNVVAFAPLALVGALVQPGLGWRDWTALGFVGSLVVELVQAVALPERTASHSDVVANTLGALLGAVAGRALLRRAGTAGKSPDIR